MNGHLLCSPDPTCELLECTIHSLFRQTKLATGWGGECTWAKTGRFGNFSCCACCTWGHSSQMFFSDYSLGHPWKRTPPPTPTFILEGLNARILEKQSCLKNSISLENFKLDLQNSSQKRVLVGGLLESFNLVWAFQSWREILVIFCLWALRRLQFGNCTHAFLKVSEWISW